MPSLTKARYELNTMWKRATGNTRPQRKAREKTPAGRIDKRFPRSQYERIASPYAGDPLMAVRNRAQKEAGTTGLSRGSLFNRIMGEFPANKIRELRGK